MRQRTSCNVLYINGQQDSVKASVTEDGKLQMFTANNKVEGNVDFSGSLADELGMQAGK